VIDDAFRARLPQLAGPLLAFYARMGWTPNQLSVVGLMIALGASLAVLTDHAWVALGLWWVSRLVDGTDGAFARQSGQVSDFGAYLDIVLDMIAYGAMVLAFAVRHPDYATAWLGMLFLYSVCIASALALGVQESKRAQPTRDDRGLRLAAGLAEGGETGIAYSAFLLWPEGLSLTTSLWVAILAWTVGARTILAWQSLATGVQESVPRTPTTPGAARTVPRTPTVPGAAETGREEASR
jgi:phosphatidylglycerophosphate synthase